MKKRSWSLLQWIRPGRQSGFGMGTEDAAPDAQLSAVGIASGAWEAGALTDARREMPPTFLHVEVEDGHSVPVVLNEQNAGMIVEVTQRVREYRERERSSIPPVYNFGGESCWSGGD